MKRLVLALAAFAVAGVLAPVSPATSVAVVNGGGNGTFTGSAPGSHFGFGVVYAGSVTGQFECNMAGNAPFGGLHLMAVEGQATAGTVNVAAGAAPFRGPGALHIHSQKMPVNFSLNVKESG